MLQSWKVAVVSAVVISVSSDLIPRSSDELCTGLSNQTTSRYLLWKRCLDFRPCFIQCYKDTRCGGFWFVHEGSLCLGRSIEYYRVGATNNNNINNNNGHFYDLCRREACPLSRGYVKLEDSGLCVKAHHEIKTWGKGRSICQAEGGDLVVLNTKLKYHSLQKYLANVNFKEPLGRRAWVGMRRGGKHDYRWLGRQPFWVNWAPRDPSYGPEKCCQISTNGMSDVRCHHARYFICEVHDMKVLQLRVKA